MLRAILRLRRRNHPSSSIYTFYRPITSTPLDQNPSLNPLAKLQLKTLVLSHYLPTTSKFFNLLQNVVASPHVLFTASHNLLITSPHHPNPSPSLLHEISDRFSLHEMSRQLSEGRFDVAACCVTLLPSRIKGESLVLSNLKLKVLIEAIRIVLEIVYDDRFVTFAYGGRVGMGRHTAVRHLKNSVVNPTWWFTVGFVERQGFGSRHVDRLCRIIGEKISDDLLIGLIKRLFECNAVCIELGSCYLGRGLPQESGLCSILINIYFSGFDRQVQDLKLRLNKKNRDDDRVVSAANVFYRPTKMYAVRYLDEILVAVASGSKMLMMDLKMRVVKFLEEELELKVDRMKTSIHSATSEKIDFMGMELQAVPPSVLHPPMSEKAIRARKKYLRQKEVKAQELRNARERNRKKLGLKILNHVFKKLKRNEKVKFEFHLENEVQEIFRSWGDEVVQEFLGSLEEKREWHRMLSAGSFLSLKRIRDQLPQELVDSYDNFMEQVDKHLSPVPAMKALGEKQRKEEEEHEQTYAQRTVDDLTSLLVKVDAPIELVRKAVKLAGFTNKMGRPRPIKLLIALDDADIVKWYAGVGRRWLDFFCCCHNFKMVKTVVTYHMRFSCILTLAEKHESTKNEAIKHYTKDLKVYDLAENEVTYFPTETEIKMMGDRNLSDPKPVDGALSLALIKLVCDDEPLHSCIAHFCDRKDTSLYRVRVLQNRLNVNPLDAEKWVSGLGAVHESVNKKCLPLCSVHASDLYMGKITLQDIDLTSYVDVD